MQGTAMNDTIHRSALVAQMTQHRALAPATHNDRCYALVAASVADANGREHPLLALHRHLPLIEALRERQVRRQAAGDGATSETGMSETGASEAEVQRVAQACGLGEQKVRALLAGAPENSPVSLRPLVLRAALGECIETQVTNLLPHTALCLALVDDDYGIQQGSREGSEEANQHCLAYGETRTYRWHCRHPGIYPMYNRLGGTAAEKRCLLGVLIVEP